MLSKNYGKEKGKLTPMVQGYKAIAVGKGAQSAKTELEKIHFADLDGRATLFEAARM